MAIDKAKTNGIAVAAAQNAFLGGINGYYVSMAARQDLIGVMATSSGRRVAPARASIPCSAIRSRAPFQRLTIRSCSTCRPLRSMQVDCSARQGSVRKSVRELLLVRMGNRPPIRRAGLKARFRLFLPGVRYRDFHGNRGLQEARQRTCAAWFMRCARPPASKRCGCRASAVFLSKSTISNRALNLTIRCMKSCAGCDGRHRLADRAPAQIQ